MSKFRASLGLLVLSFLVPLAAFADGRCMLYEIDGLESNKTKELLILANHLDVSGSAPDRTWISNDSTIKLQIKKSTALAANAQLQVNVFVNGAMVLRSTSQAYSSSVANQSAVLLADGRALMLLCLAQKD